MSKRKTTEEFIEDAKKVHGDRYGYQNATYSSNHNHVNIVCFIHGDFLQSPANHCRGKGCPKCAGNVQLTTEDFRKKAKDVHGDRYDYSFSKYNTGKENLTIICKTHGKFEQSAVNHLKGKGCPECGKLIRISKKTYTIDVFLKRAEDVHGDRYDYSKVEYTGRKNAVTIICKVHGEFLQMPETHYKGCGCPECKRELFIGKNNPNYVNGLSYEQKKFRNTPEALKWAKVIKRGRVSCDCCHTVFTNKVRPEAHHLNSWNKYTDQRFDKNNGVALCKRCHKEFHKKYGRGNNTKKQYKEFKALRNVST